MSYYTYEKEGLTALSPESPVEEKAEKVEKANQSSYEKKTAERKKKYDEALMEQALLFNTFNLRKAEYMTNEAAKASTRHKYCTRYREECEQNAKKYEQEAKKYEQEATELEQKAKRLKMLSEGANANSIKRRKEEACARTH